MGICVGTAYAIITYMYVGMWERDLPAMYRKGLNVIGGRFIWLVSAEYLYKDIYMVLLSLFCVPLRVLTIVDKPQICIRVSTGYRPISYSGITIWGTEIAITARPLGPLLHQRTVVL